MRSQPPGDLRALNKEFPADVRSFAFKMTDDKSLACPMCSLKADVKI